MKEFLKKILPYVGIVAGFLLLSYAFVPEVLSGKIVNQSDISGWQGMSHEMMSWNGEHPDDETAWTESMFGGMPTVTIHAPSHGDWTQYIYDALLTGRRPATYLFISLLGAFLLMLSFGTGIWPAAGAAIAVTFCAYNFQIIQVGHNTKMQALAFLPWALAAFVFTYRKALSLKSRWLPLTLLGAAFFGLAMSFQVKANHPQITYYLALMAIIYAVVLLVWMCVEKKFKEKIGRFATASALLIVLGLAGVATNANKLLPIWEYTPYSMRGGTSAQAAGSTGGEARKGLDLDYATAWSYGWEELPNIAIPNYNGGSSAGALGSGSETVKLLREAGQSGVDEISKNLPLYWGPQPFTAGPMYMGAVTIFLFILGLFFFKGKEKWWVIACTVLAVLLAVGNHFLPFTRFFYEYVPLYNKFRTVSMALVVLQFTLPVLGFLALDKMMRSDAAPRETRNCVVRAGAVTLGIILFLSLVQSLFGTFQSASDSGIPGQLADALTSDRKALLWKDCLRTMLFIAGCAAVLYWGLTIPSSAQKSFANNPDMVYSRRRTAVILSAVLVLLDMFIAGKRYLNSEDFIAPRRFQAQFTKRPVDEIILQDTDPSYRVLDLTVNVFNDSHPSFWHKNIGGYSPAKLQIYQEYIDRHLSGELNALYKALSGVSTIQEAQDSLPCLEGLSKLNCRYIILDPQAPPVRYPYAKGEAWFRDGADSLNTIAMTSYAPNELRYEYESGEGGRAVFSEVYYPKGWKATLEDGKELPIELEDEIFRGIDLPAGKHTLTMRFAPDSYRIGADVSKWSSILLILTVLLSSAAAACFEKKWK